MANRTAILSIRIVSDADGRGFAKAARQADRFASRMAKSTAKVAAITAAAAVAAGAVGQVGIAGAAIGTGIAAGAALAVPALVAIKLGADGIKQAAEAAAPAAAKLKAAVSGKFASDMVPGFQAFGRVLTSITPEMTTLAGSISEVFNGIAGTVERNTAGLKAMTRGASTFVTALGPGLNQLTAGFIKFGANAATVAGQLGADFSSVLGKIGEWIGNIPIAKLVTEYRGMIKQLFAGIGDLVGPLVSLFGQLALALGPSLGAIFSSLGAAVREVTPGLVEMARVAGPALAETFANLAPAAGDLVTGLAGIVTAIAPVLPVVAQLVALLADALGPALPAIVAGMVAYSSAMKVAGVASTALSAGTTASQAALGLLTGKFSASSTAATRFGVQLRALAAMSFGGALSAMGNVLKIVAVGLRTAAVATWSFTAALLANPITWVVIAVVALIAVIVLIATKTTWFQTAWAAMCSAVVAAWNWVKGAVAAVVEFIGALFSAFIAGVQAQWQLIQTAAAAVWNFIQTIVQTVISVIGSIIAAHVAAVSAAWNMIQAAASAVWSAIQGVVSAVMGAIQSAISGAINAGIAVFNTFRSVGMGVFNAVAGAVSAVGNAINTVIGWVRSLISALANIRFPSPPGWLSKVFEAPGFTLGPDSARIVTGVPGVLTAAAAPAPRPGFAAGGSAVIYQIDQSTHVTVDGSGVVDVQAVADSVTGALGRNQKTRGGVPAVRLGAARA